MAYSKLARGLAISDLGRKVVIETAFGSISATLTDFTPSARTMFNGAGVEGVFLESVDLTLTASPRDEQRMTVDPLTEIQFAEEEQR